MRKIFIADSACTDEALMEVADQSPLAALLWPWFLLSLDDWGRGSANPRQLRARLFPENPAVTVELLAEALERFAAAGLVVRYEAGGKQHVAVPAAQWFRYQTHVRAEKRTKDGSRYPAPHEETAREGARGEEAARECAHPRAAARSSRGCCAGRCAVVPDGIEPGIMDSHLVRLRLDHASFDSRFLARVIDDAPYVRAQFDAMAKGSIMAGLNSSLVKNLLLCQPPVAEQKIIVELLDRETEVIDALIVKKQRLIELLQEKRTALISHAVTKGLDPHVRMRDSGIAILATIPAAWRVLPLRRVLERVKQGWSPECDERPAAEGAWGVLKTSCINGGAFDELQNKSLPADRPPQPDLEVRGAVSRHLMKQVYEQICGEALGV